jgi:drug/metabolite transporter (DMT)-like permease
MTRLLAVAGVLAMSFSAIFFRLAAVSPATAAFFRTAYAVPVLLLIWSLFRRRQDRRRGSDRLMALGAGVLLALDLVLWHRAIELIGAGLGTVLANVQVVFVGVAAWVIHRERPTLLAALVVPVVFGGVALISGLGRADAYGADPEAGVLFGVAAGASYAGFLLAIRASNRVLDPPAGPLLDATFGAMLGTVAFGVVDPGFSLRLAWPAHGWLLALALLVQVFGWLLVTRALPRLPALETSVMLLLQPMATVLWAFLLFAERLAALQWLGVVLVLAGVGALMALGSARPAPRLSGRQPELLPGP